MCRSYTVCVYIRYRYTHTHNTHQQILQAQLAKGCVFVCECMWAQYSDCNPIFRTLILTFLPLVPNQNNLNAEQSECWQMFYYISWAISILYTSLWSIIQLLQIFKPISTIWNSRKIVAFPYTEVSFWRYLLTHNVRMTSETRSKSDVRSIYAQ